MYKKILVPLDGSQTAEGVLPHAKALAYCEGAEIILLNVASNPALEFAFSDPTIAAKTLAEQEERNRTYMSELESQLSKAGFKVSSILAQGSAADAILKVADELEVDVITMSTHGRSGAARWLLGSVADRVVRHSKHPVMLIRTEK